MIRRFAAAVVLLASVFAFVGPVAPASAGGGPSDYADCSVQVSPPKFAPGRMVTVNGRGFEPNFLTTIFLDDEDNILGTVTTDARGRFVTRVLIPETTSVGPHTIGAYCDSQLVISDTDVEVSSAGAARAATPAAPLPSTGSDSTEPLVVAGGLALLAGTAFVLVARRRRQSHVGV